MIRRLAAIPILLLLALLCLPARAQDTAGRLAHQDGNNVFTASTNDFYFAGTLADPPPPVASAGSASGGSCSSAITYRLYLSYKNATGETDLSPPSIEFTPASGTTNKITITRPATIPANVNTWSAWFTYSTDDHVVVYGCGTSGSAVDTARATATYDCLCSTSTDATEPTSNTTENVYIMRIAQGPSSNLVTFGSGLTVSGGSFIRSGPRVKEVCPVGCEYATLNAACAAETSTAANPITYQLHVGVYAAADTMCSGEDHASFIGDGRGVTVLQGIDHGAGYVAGNDCSAAVLACKGALNLGTSTNIEVSDMTLKGNIGLWWNGASTGGGASYLHDLELTTTTSNDDEAGMFFRGFASGAVLRVENNFSTSRGDGFVIDNDGTTEIVSRGNEFRTTSTIAPTSAAWHFQSIPCAISADLDYFAMTGGKTSINELYGYYFEGTPGDGSSGCSAGVAKVSISNSLARMHNTTTDGNAGQVSWLKMDDTALELGHIRLVNNNVEVISDDDTTGFSYAVRHEVPGLTDWRIIGGRYDAIGSVPGATNEDISPKAALVTPAYTLGVDFDTPVFTSDTLPIPQLYTQVTKGASFVAPATIDYEAPDNNIGLYMHNTDAANNESSPLIKLCSSAVSAECRHLYVDANGSIDFDTTVGTNIFRLRIPADIVQSYLSRFSLENAGSSLEIGGDHASDANQILFNTATTDASLVWVASANRLNLTNVEVFRTAPLVTAPAACSIGDWYVDTSGAYCACTATNTWTNMTPLTGACT